MVVVGGGATQGGDGAMWELRGRCLEMCVNECEHVCM